MAANDSRHHITWGTRFRFLVRVVGVSGFLVAVVGGGLFHSALPITTWSLDLIRSAGNGTHGEFAEVSAWLLISGAVAVAIALAAELLGGLIFMTGSRTAASFEAILGIIAAVLLLVVANIISFMHHGRYDLTRDARYTLPPEVVEQLRKLRTQTPTTIVVLQMHKTFGDASSRRDPYTSSADHMVTEKVKELVDLFRELGPRFNVVVLDSEDIDYDEALADLTKDAPDLKTAIEDCPENSIFFHVPKHVQRLAFNEFLQLDKTASKAADGGRGNLVLLPQGAESFARRVLSIQERRPKVGICVVHELLTSDYPQGPGRVYTLAGLKETLTDHGFDVVNIVLKKNWGSASSLEDLKPTAEMREEAKVERLEGKVSKARIHLAAAHRTILTLERVQEEIDKVKNDPWSKRELLYRQLFRESIAEQDEPELLATIVKQLAKARDSLEPAKKKLRDADDALQEALKDERTTEARRIEDAKIKLTRALADVDLLVIPRHTFQDATVGESPEVGANILALRKEQVEVIRDFMAAGKPVLACMGSISDADGPSRSGQDGFEALLAERGVYLGDETILFDVEAQAFESRISGDQFGSVSPADIPPLVLQETAPANPKLKRNPIASAFDLTVRGVSNPLSLRGVSNPLSLSKKALRPVSLFPGWQDTIPFSSEFLLTSPDSWNEEHPFMQTERRRLADGRTVRIVTYTPEFEPTTVKDPKWGTPRAVRKGPFCIGVAIESKVPVAWVKDDYYSQEFVGGLLSSNFLHIADPVMAASLTVAANRLERKTQRLVVFGSGTIFTGLKLDTAEQELLLHSANWLTKREDRLPHADLPVWTYPRVSMNEREHRIWQFGTGIWLPLGAIYLGLIAMLIRRLW